MLKFKCSEFCIHFDRAGTNVQLFKYCSLLFVHYCLFTNITIQIFAFGIAMYIAILSLYKDNLNQNTPGVKKVAAKNFKKGCAEKDVKSKWAAKASCC